MVFTAVDTPFLNGLNERLNQTLISRIRCKINEYLLYKYLLEGEKMDILLLELEKYRELSQL